MMNHTLTNAIKHWKYIAPIVAYPKVKKDFNQLVSCLDKLLEIVGDQEDHPLIGLVDYISNVISLYEEKHYKHPMGKGIDALKFLMDAHQLQQTDLSEIASQGVMSEILNGKRQLNLRHIKLLAKYFNVDPSTFID